MASLVKSTNLAATWPNPLNNKIEDKASYVEKMGDYFVGVGIYRD